MTEEIERLKAEARLTREATEAELARGKQDRIQAFHKYWSEVVAQFAIDYPMLRPFISETMTDEMADECSSNCELPNNARVWVNIPRHHPFQTVYYRNKSTGAWAQSISYFRNHTWETLDGFNPSPLDPFYEDCLFVESNDLGGILLAAEAGFVSWEKAIAAGREMALEQARLADKARRKPLPSNDRLAECLEDWLVERGFSKCGDDDIEF